MNRFENIKKLITKTPLVNITYKYNNNINHVYAKCEWFSLTGSIKDKTAYQILLDAYNSHLLKQGMPIVEVSSGNMGISLSALGNILGNPVTIIMPKHMSEERKKLIKLYGATLIETEDFPSAFALANEFEKRGYFYPRQFENNSNKYVHSTITASEILEQTRHFPIDNFVSGIGTSGTFSGIGETLKKERNLNIIAIEPTNARIITSFPPYEKHKLQGLSDEILPKLYNKSICDKVIQVSDDDAIAMARKLCQKFSLGVGISSGANIIGCILCGGNSITIFPDDNKKYLSTDLTENIETPFVKSIELINFEVISQ